MGGRFGRLWHQDFEMSQILLCDMQQSIDSEHFSC
jgi:hypothetical protein